MRLRLLALLAATISVLAACSSSTKGTQSAATCPDGKWQLSAVSTRDLIGLEQGGAAGNVTGAIMFSLQSDGRALYTFRDVTLASATTPGGPTRTNVRIGGTISGTATRTATTLTIEVRSNTIQVTSGGTPVRGETTAYVSSSLEEDLTGTMTFACRGPDLSTVDGTRNTELLWNPLPKG